MTCDVTTTLGYPATINTPEYADVIADAADTMGYTPVEESGSLGGEDFAYFLMEKPGAYFHVGMADPDRPITSAASSWMNADWPSPWKWNWPCT